jgi:opacity protein-like surface antigen
MDIFFTNILKIFQKFFYYFLIFFLLHINESQAFVGGSSMGSGGGASSGTPSIKSGISIVDPEGKSFNCEPFVDKKWESTSNEDSWNGVYFSIGAEASKISGAFKIENSISMAPLSVGYSFSRTIGTFPDLNSSKSFKGSSSIPVLNVGGGFLIDRMYLASDLEIRMSPFEFDQKIKILETIYTRNTNGSGETSVTKDSESTFTFTFNNYLMFNSKIGYLLTDKSMIYFNAGIGSFNFSNIKFKGDYSVPESDIGDISPPIRLSLGTEFLLSNHFRLVADYSYWIVPQIMGSFYLENQKNQTKGLRSTNSYVADFKINSLKLGILYRF